MEQQSLIHGFVARGDVILAEYSEGSKERLASKSDTHKKYSINDNGFTFGVVALESTEREIPTVFLERVKEDFNKRYGGGKAVAAVANSLNKDFGPKLKEHMKYCVDHPEEISKLAKVKAQVLEVQVAIEGNIGQLTNRGENISILVGKADDLRRQAQTYDKVAKKISWKMWIQNMKIKLIVLVIIIALILIIVLSVCHGFKC
ncbi:putative vesicle-associated membrane protein 726 [Macadamia integrifolia]|uniref:putative vesicle-associated membrane protein 726 n=1 Tax=Macadamia integrifolia TaxID=60698 RepID=UPI001C4FD7E7|nr:putative vesicle-associated membrane protein 726 [Macadamia integrifolia]